MFQCSMVFLLCISAIVGLTSPLTAKAVVPFGNPQPLAEGKGESWNDIEIDGVGNRHILHWSPVEHKLYHSYSLVNEESWTTEFIGDYYRFDFIQFGEEVVASEGNRIHFWSPDLSHRVEVLELPDSTSLYSKKSLFRNSQGQLSVVFFGGTFENYRVYMGVRHAEGDWRYSVVASSFSDGSPFYIIWDVKAVTMHQRDYVLINSQINQTLFKIELTILDQLGFPIQSRSVSTFKGFDPLEAPVSPLQPLRVGIFANDIGLAVSNEQLNVFWGEFVGGLGRLRMSELTEEGQAQSGSPLTVSEEEGSGFHIDVKQKSNGDLFVAHYKNVNTADAAFLLSTGIVSEVNGQRYWETQVIRPENSILHGQGTLPISLAIYEDKVHLSLTRHFLPTVGHRDILYYREVEAASSSWPDVFHTDETKILNALNRDHVQSVLGVYTISGRKIQKGESLPQTVYIVQFRPRPEVSTKSVATSKHVLTSGNRSKIQELVNHSN